MASLKITDESSQQLGLLDNRRSEVVENEVTGALHMNASPAPQERKHDLLDRCLDLALMHVSPDKLMVDTSSSKLIGIGDMNMNVSEHSESKMEQQPKPKASVLDYNQNNDAKNIDDQHQSQVHKTDYCHDPAVIKPANIDSPIFSNGTSITANMSSVTSMGSNSNTTDPTSVPSNVGDAANIEATTTATTAPTRNTCTMTQQIPIECFHDKDEISIHHVESKLKITILNLSGIVVRAIENVNEFGSPSKRRAQNFSITASVSFTGSCDPADLRVVSSGLCSSTGRLQCESQAVVVPNGMTDGLVAVWDDSRPTLDLQDLLNEGAADENNTSLYTTDKIIFGKKRGVILACPDVNPHLFVTVRDTIQEKAEDRQQQQPSERESESAQTPTSSEENAYELAIESGTSLPSWESNANEGGTNFSTLQRTHSTQSDYKFTVVNTPSAADLDTSSVPEILEIQVALHINQIPNGQDHDDERKACYGYGYGYGKQKINDEYEDLNSVRSSCPPESGAVAHLVLFPDILRGDNFNSGHNGDPNSDEDEIDTSRIIELPVRKPFSRGVSNVSGENNRGIHDWEMKGKRFARDPEAYVDLEDDAIIRLKIERCTVNEEKSLKRRDECMDAWMEEEESKRDLETDVLNEFGHTLTGTKVSRSLFDDDVQLNINHTNHTRQTDQTDKRVNKADYDVEDLIREPSEKEEEELYNNALHDSLVGQVNSSRGEDEESTVDEENEGIEYEYKMSNENLQSTPSPGHEAHISCGRGLTLDGLLRSLSGMFMHCSDEVHHQVLTGGGASMDSTIFTSGSMR